MQQASVLDAADPASKLCAPPYHSYCDRFRRPRPARSSKELFTEGKQELWGNCFAAIQEVSKNVKSSEQLCTEARDALNHKLATCNKTSAAVEEADKKIAGFEQQLRLAKQHRYLLVKEAQAADEALSEASEKLVQAEAKNNLEEELASKGADEIFKADNSPINAETDCIPLDISPASVPDGGALSMRSAPQEENVTILKTSRDGDSDGQTGAGESVEEKKEDTFSLSPSTDSSIDERRDSTDNQCSDIGSSSPAPLDSRMNKSGYSTDGRFSITVTTMAGKQLEIKGLYAGMHARDVALRIAAETGIPPFAVTLDHGGQLITMDSQMLLRECGIEDGSDLFLLKLWGWGKPDMRLLSELSAKWGGKQTPLQE